MKFTLPSSLFSLAFLSVASAMVATCGYEPELVNDAPDDFVSEPISIISQDVTTVTFSVSQTWSDDLLCLIATHYTADSGEACPDVANTGPGEFAEYTATCVEGYADVDLYVYDPTLLDNASPPTVASICEQTTPAKTYLYQYRIPCSAGDAVTCPPPEDVSCEYMPPMEYDFESTSDVDGWLFGKQGNKDGNSFLQLDADVVEVAKKFDIDAEGTTAATFEFDFLTVSPLASDQKVFIRVGEYYLNMTAAIALTSAKTEYFADIKTSYERLDASSIKVSVEIPSTMYSDGSISVGLRTSGSSSTFVAGVDNAKLVLECDATLPPGVDFTGSTKAGGGGGDPHFQMWDREHISFHGECDLVMAHSEQFHNGAGLDLHVRTTIEDYFSYIETAALRLGEATLEFHKDHFFLDGNKYTNDNLPLTFGEGDYKYTVSEGEIEAGKNVNYYNYYQVDLGDDSSIIFKYYKKFLTIAVNGHSNDFSDSVGLLGDYATGNMLSRDGQLMTDYDQYGFEWQVNPEDAKIFLDARAPQLPYESCRMPTAARPARRKLRGSDSALYESAKQACAHVRGSDFDLCADDVMTTGDVGLASLW